MEKIIDLDMTVADLVGKYPEIKDVLIEIGFKELQNKLMLNSVGKFMTLKRGSVVKNISMDHIKEKLIEQDKNPWDRSKNKNDFADDYIIPVRTFRKIADVNHSFLTVTLPTIGSKHV
mgnify:CR=1 FL=1